MATTFDKLFDEIHSEKSPSTSSSNFDSLFDEISNGQPKKSIGRKVGRTALQLGLAGAERALTPYELAASAEYSPSTKTLEHRQDLFEEIAQLGTKKRKGTITPEEEKYLQNLIEETKSPEKTLEGFEKAQGDQKIGIRGAVEKASGIDTTPEGFLENAANWYGYLKDPRKVIKSLDSWKNIRNLPKSELIKKFMPSTDAISAIAAGLGSEAGEGGKIGLGTGALVFGSIIANLRKGKLMPVGKEMQELYRVGKELGLTEKEMTPIIQSRFKLNTVGALAEPTERAGRAIETSESALGRIYDDLKVSKSSAKEANPHQIGKLLNSLEEVGSELRMSKYVSPEREQVLKIIDKMINDIAANGINPGEIVSTWRAINKDINWNSIDAGKELKNKLKDPLATIFSELDPKNAQKFLDTNKMWAKLQKTANKIRPGDSDKLIKAGEVATAFTGIYNLVTKGSSTLLKGLLGAKAMKYLATEMLINPHLNNIMNKTLAGFTKGSKKSARKAVQDLVEFLKNDPKSSKEGDWDILLKED